MRFYRCPDEKEVARLETRIPLAAGMQAKVIEFAEISFSPAETRAGGQGRKQFIAVPRARKIAMNETQFHLYAIKANV